MARDNAAACGALATRCGPVPRIAPLFLGRAMPTQVKQPLLTVRLSVSQAVLYPRRPFMTSIVLRRVFARAPPCSGLARS